MRCDFYAAESDLHLILDQVESSKSLRYAVAGLQIDAAPVEASSWKALCPVQSEKRSYLVFEPQYLLAVRPVPQRAGGTLFAVDELANPNAISLLPGVTTSPVMLHPGLIGTTASSGPATSLIRAYKTAIKANFTRVKSYWVGPCALALLRSGARLTISEAAPQEYDLTEKA